MPAWDTMDGDTLLHTLEQHAVEQGISDIHLSPEKEQVRLEVRLHGVLELLAEISPKQYIDFVRRVKFTSKLKLNLTNIPQDGQYTFIAQDRQVNVRVASLPSRFGEKFTLRLLDPKRGIVPLETLGFPKAVETQLREVAAMPNGLFLVTGPTGSGKTTTLYSLLNTLIGTARNIITLEDPIEYEIAGIVQSEVDHEHDYDFARGLRSILRHDPDVVLVGEIRDLETAQTAVDAALTGHMVFATLHTNSAVEALPRLLSMGVSPYTVAPALRAVLAQRLVRTVKTDLDPKAANFDASDNNSYDDRMCIPEFLLVDETIRELILLNETAQEILKVAQEKGYKTMREWGNAVVKSGQTTQSEVDRVTL